MNKKYLLLVLLAVLFMMVSAVYINGEPRSEPALSATPTVPILEIPQDFETPGLYPAEILAARIDGKEIPVIQKPDQYGYRYIGYPSKMVLRSVHAKASKDGQVVIISGILYISSPNCKLSSVIDMDSGIWMHVTVVWKCTDQSGIFFTPPQELVRLVPNIRNDTNINIYVDLAGVGQIDQ